MYSRRLEGRTLSFGHEGVLYKNSFVMYDRETGSLWVHTTGEAVRGPLQGKQLQFLPSTITTWSKWKSEHPQTLVLTGRRADEMMGRFDLNRDRRRYGLSVGQGVKVKLYPFELLPSDGVVNDEVHGVNVVVVVDGATGMGAAFEREDLVFKAQNGQMIDQTGRSWNRLAGTVGELKLKPIPATPWLIDRWCAFFCPDEARRRSQPGRSGPGTMGRASAPPSLASTPHAQHPAGQFGNLPGAFPRPGFSPGIAPPNPPRQAPSPSWRGRNPSPFSPPRYLDPFGQSLGR